MHATGADGKGWLDARSSPAGSPADTAAEALFEV